MQEKPGFEATRKLRQDLVKLFEPTIESSLSHLKLERDREIDQEIRERIAVMVFDELVNDMPTVPYLAVWEEGASDIVHAYMSPKIETLSGYTPQELIGIGYVNIVGGDIISFYREKSRVEEEVHPRSEAQKRRVSGFIGNRNWEGCYKVKRKDGDAAWVIDRSTITRFRNDARGNVICLSGGILLETTELLERREKSGTQGTELG